jgi:hypothetical protein
MAVAALVFFFETGKGDPPIFAEERTEFLNGRTGEWEVFLAIDCEQGFVVRHGVEFLSAVAGDAEFREVAVFDADFGAVTCQLRFGETGFAAEWIAPHVTEQFDAVAD